MRRIGGHGPSPVRCWMTVATAAAAVAGCGGDARVELSAADALQATAAQMRTALEEYHGEVEAHDDGRESAIVRAFVERVRRDAADETRAARHADEFEAALARVRGDRRTEWLRWTNAQTQVDAVMEVAKGLRRIGLESLSLRDEVRRYLLTWVEARAAARGGSAGRPTAATGIDKAAPGGDAEETRHE